MDAHSAAFFEFREVTQSLHTLPVPEKTLSLEYALFHAIERAHDAQRRVRELEVRQEELRAESVARDQEQDAFARQLHADLRSATRALACANAAHAREVDALQRKLHAAEAHCDGLCDLCRSLLATIEQAAADSGVGASADTDADAEPARVPA